MSDKILYNDVVPAGSSFWHINATSFYLPRLLKFHLENDSILNTKQATGTLSVPIRDFLNFLEESGGKKGIIQDDSEYAYLWGPSFINVSFTKKTNNITLTGFLADPLLVDMFDLIEEKFISKNNKNFVFSIIKTSAGLEIKNLGNGSFPLIKDNYHPEVIVDLEYVVESFKKIPPSGRICILNGEPGTGKTHLIRSLLSEIDCVYLIVPSNIISSLDSPEFLPLLLKVKDSHEKPIILIIEDGDTCLIPRKNDNVSAITSLLNLSDGILGSIIDIKMIITTNAYIKDMDQAIMRPGRLCKNINVGPLEYIQANRVFHRLMGSQEKSLEKRKQYTLAEIYNVFSNKDNPVQIYTKYKPIGFHSPQVNLENLTLNSLK